MTNSDKGNPNLIPLPETNRYAMNEPGKTTKTLSTPHWLAEPIEGTSTWDNNNAEGDIPQHLE